MTHDQEFRRQVSEIVTFLDEKKMQAYDLVIIAKMLCCCGTCKYFEQHYTKEGEALDWGHCFKGNVQHSKKIWDNGMKTKLGSIGIEAQKEGAKFKNHAKRMNQEFGWALVRLGFKMMLPKCVWAFGRETGPKI